MKTSSKASAFFVVAVAFLFGLTEATVAHAATAPNLGISSSYAVYGHAGMTNSGAGTNIWGSVGDNGVSHAGLIVGQVNTGILDAGAGIEGAALSAYGEMAAQGVDAALDLAGNNTIIPGLYNVGATTLNGTLTLNGPGVYIFRSSSSISTSGAAKVKLINGATACNVFWQIPTSMTIGAGSEIVGTIIANTGAITLADSASLQGRAFSLVTQVTLINNQLTQPTCTASGNEDVTIKVKKTASDYTLKSGPEKVTFTYKVTNEGDAALTNISVNDDKCDDVNYVSGDKNDDDKLDTNEEWKFECKKTVKKTETNTVTAKGTANGEEVKDTDTAKVTVSDSSEESETSGVSKASSITPGFPNAGIGPDDNFWDMISQRIISFFSF